MVLRTYTLCRAHRPSCYLPTTTYLIDFPCPPLGLDQCHFWNYRHSGQAAFALPSAFLYAEATDGATLVGMPSYFLQDCHYFYRTALRGLNISTSVSPLYA